MGRVGDSGDSRRDLEGVDGRRTAGDEIAWKGKIGREEMRIVVGRRGSGGRGGVRAVGVEDVRRELGDESGMEGLCDREREIRTEG